MKNSRTSLNKPFYDWIKQVREADKKIAELEDKLYYYNVKLIGYNSPNFEPRLSSTKPQYKDDRYIWIEKINYIEGCLNKNVELKIYYQKFLRSLDLNSQRVVEDYFENNTNTEYSKSYKYNKLNKISIEYLKFKKKYQF